MTLVVQGITAPSVKRALTNIVTEPYRNATIMPSGLLIHTQDSVAVDAIGVGDTARLRLTLTLQEGFAYMLNHCNLIIRAGDDTAATWANAALELFYVANETIPAGASTQLSYPMPPSTLLEGADPSDVVFMPGAVGGNSSSTTPGALFPQANPGLVLYGGKTNPVFNVWNVTADVGPWTMSYLFEWLVFNIEQANHAGMYTPVPVRS